MSDEQNPYRFTGDAPEEIAPTSEIARRLTLRDLQAISRGRRLLALFLAVLGGSCVLALAAIALAPSPHVHPPLVLSPYYDATLTGAVGFLIGMVGVFLVGAKMISLLGRRFAVAEALALLVPGPNALVAALLIHDAKRTLESRDVRIGWIASNFSEAQADDDHWRPRDL